MMMEEFDDVKTLDQEIDKLNEQVKASLQALHLKEEQLKMPEGLK